MTLYPYSMKGMKVAGHGKLCIPHFRLYLNGEYLASMSLSFPSQDVIEGMKKKNISPLTAKQMEVLQKYIYKTYKKRNFSGDKMYRKSKKDVRISWNFVGLS